MNRKIKYATFAALLVVTAFALTSCSSSKDSKSENKKIDKESSVKTKSEDNSKFTSEKAIVIQTFAYDPNPVDVSVGTKITWTDNDQINHTVTSGTREKPTKVFDGFLANKGATYSKVFNNPGTYTYFCSIHPGMNGTINVK